VGSLPGSPTTGQIYRLTSSDSTNKAPPGLYYYTGSAWVCLSYDSVYDLGNLGATPSLSLVVGAAYEATQDEAITSLTVSLSGPGTVTITKSGEYTCADPSMASRTLKERTSDGWTDAGAALAEWCFTDDGTYLIASAVTLA